MAFLFKSKTKVKGEVVNPNFAVSKDPSEWNVSEVCEWLSMMNLTVHKDTFKEQAITGSDLIGIDENDLDSLKIVKFADRKRLMNGIRTLTGREVKPFDASSYSSKTSKYSTETGSVTSDTDITEEFEVPITVKCYYNDDIRTIDVETSSLDALRKRISEEYGNLEFTLKYRDDENELVSLNSNSGLKAALRNNTSLLKLHLTNNQILTESEVKIMDDMVDSVIIMDTKGYMIYVNPATLKMFGYSKKELIHKNIKMLMNKKDARKHNDYLERYSQTGIPQIIGKGRIVDCKDSEGKEFKARLSVSETKKEKHFYTGTLHKLELDDQANQLVTSHNFLILDSFLDATVVIGDSGTMVFFNKAAEILFGYNRSECIGRNVKMLMPDPFKSEHDSYLNNYNRSHVSKIMNTGRDVPLQLKDGTIEMKQLKLSQQEMGGKIFYTGVFAEPLNKNSEKLTEMEQERVVLKDLLVPAIIIDEKGIIQMYNETASKTFGFSVVEVLGKNINFLMFEEDAIKHDKYIKNHIESGINKVIGIGRKVNVKRKDGSCLSCKLFVTKKSNGVTEKPFFTGILQPCD